MTTFTSKNVKLQNVIKTLSPKSYLKNMVFESIKEKLHKKRKKIPSDDFEIPDVKDFNFLLTKGYNVKQLKDICKFYKQKKSGNKSELIFLLYNYLKFSFYAIKIQKIFRGHLRRSFDKIRGPAIHKRNLCTNQTDFFTLEELKDIEKSQFYSFKDKDGFIYGFDICSLYNMIVIEKIKDNPYNRNKLPINKIMYDLRVLVKRGKLFNEAPNIKLETNINELSAKKQIELKALELFQHMDQRGFITNPNWFLSLPRLYVKRFLRELVDVWEYRAQIDHETKRKINPQHGNPFFGFNIHVLLHKPYEVLQKRVLDLIEIFVTKGEDNDAKYLGVCYVLGALTTVSHDCAIALPWLYSAFGQPVQQ